MNPKRFHEWLNAHTDNATTRELAAAIGSTHTTLGRQFSGVTSLDPVLVINLARAYDLNVLDALVAAEIISLDEANAPATSTAIAQASDSALAREILRRAEESEALDRPVSEIASNVHDPGPVWGRQASTNSILDDLEGEEFVAYRRRDHEDDPVEP